MPLKRARHIRCLVITLKGLFDTPSWDNIDCLDTVKSCEWVDKAGAPCHLVSLLDRHSEVM